MVVAIQLDEPEVGRVGPGGAAAGAVDGLETEEVGVFGLDVGDFGVVGASGVVGAAGAVGSPGREEGSRVGSAVGPVAGKRTIGAMDG